MYCYQTLDQLTSYRRMREKSKNMNQNVTINFLSARSKKSILVLYGFMPLVFMFSLLFIACSGLEIAAESVHEDAVVVHEEAVTVYEIRSGDTLWSIAQSHASRNESVPYYIFKIQELNEGLNVASLQIGQKIYLP